MRNRTLVAVAVFVVSVLTVISSGSADARHRHPTTTTTTTSTSTTTTTVAPSTTTTVPPPTTTTTTTPATTTTTVLPSAVFIPAGSNIQAQVNAKPGGTTFRLGAGLFAGQTVVPLSGDTFLFADGAVMDGQGGQYAFVANPANNVTIRAEGVGIVRNYNPPADPQAAVGGHGNSGSGWVIDGLEVTGITGGAAVRLSPGGLVRNVNVHDNPGKVGITGYLASGRIEGGRVVNNNSAHLYDPNWDAGGIKLATSSNVTITGVEVAGNWGPGIWCDIACTNVTITGNNSHDNHGPGIHYEVSSWAVISNNRVWNNGGAYTGGWAIHQSNILVSLSHDVEVTGNDVGGGSNGIVGWQDDNHPDRGQLGGDEVLRNLWVHGNTIGPVALWPTAIRTLNLNPIYGYVDADYQPGGLLNNRLT